MTFQIGRGIAYVTMALFLLGPAAAQQSQQQSSGGEPAATENRRAATPAARAVQELLSRQSDGRTTEQQQKRREAIRAFYEQRNFEPFWFEDGEQTARVEAMVGTLANAHLHGLRSENYGLPDLATRVQNAPGGEIAELEVTLTRRLIEYASDVRTGRIQEPRRLGGLYHEAPDFEATSVLDAASSADNFQAFLDGLPTQARRYQQLVHALAQYRDIAASGGWPKIDDGETLRLEDRDPRVVQVRRRLAITGDLTASTTEPEFYGPDVAVAVQRFQERHGLEKDGAVGPNTRAAMNVPVQRRIQQIIINLERRRWTAERLGDYYIFVNIADNYLKVVQNDETIHVARVVVGRPYHKTPIFSKEMTYVRINPHWNVPRSIATREMLPRIKQDPSYLTRNHYLLLREPAKNNTAVDPASVNWSQVSAESFPYYVRQTPGPWNALGTMIFMFPNRFNVFLHDTSSREVFDRNNRFFSHGCVRVQYPHVLANLLLKYNDGWSEQRLDEMLERDNTVIVRLDRPVMVHITYLTSWALRRGTVHFREDAYERDDELIQALRDAQNGLPLDVTAGAN